MSTRIIDIWGGEGEGEGEGKGKGEGEGEGEGEEVGEGERADITHFAGDLHVHE